MRSMPNSQPAFTNFFQKRIANPVMRRMPFQTLLETTGRKSGEPRRVPLAGRADDTGVWVISQHGRRAGWAYNIAADPKVRVRIDSQWRSGTATFEPDDDVRARARSFGGDGKISQSATALTIRAMESDPISVRITFD